MEISKYLAMFPIKVDTCYILFTCNKIFQDMETEKFVAFNKSAYKFISNLSNRCNF